MAFEVMQYAFLTRTGEETPFRPQEEMLSLESNPRGVASDRRGVSGSLIALGVEGRPQPPRSLSASLVRECGRAMQAYTER